MMRRLVQVLGLILPNAYYRAFTGRMLYQGPLKGFCIPVLNCYGCPLALYSCPVGTLQHFVVIRAVPIYVIGLLGIVGSSVGSLVCGWVCPFGALQEMMYKIKSFKVKIPYKFRYMRYVTLILLVGILPFFFHETWYCKLCPQGALEAGIPLAIFSTQIRSLLGSLFVVKAAILAGFAFLFIISKRPFCMTFCPLGALLFLFNRFSLLRLKVVKESCTECNLCVDPCPTGIVPFEEVDSVRCVRCWECIRICPTGAIRAELIRFWKSE